MNQRPAIAATALPEQELLGRIRSGDEDAFASFVAAHERAVFGLAYHMVRSTEDARDLTQETFLRAYRAMPRFRGDSALGTWLHRITMNVCLNHLSSASHRASRRAEPLEREDGEGRGLTDRFAHGGPTPEQAAHRSELIAMTAEALITLTPEFRAVVVLREVKGMDYKEIAEILEIAEGTVKSRLARGRMMLRDALAAKGVKSA